jgi:hypothetical protein
VACADGEIEVEEDRQLRAIAAALAINAGVLELEFALAVGLSERPAVGVAGREVGKIFGICS